MDPDINSPRVQQWNVTVEQQLGTQLGRVGELSGQLLRSALGADGAQPRRVPGPRALHAQYRHGPRSYPVCSTNANLNQRRVLSLENPSKARSIGALDLNTDIGWQKYRGLKLAARRRTATGLSLNGNYTLSRCKGTPTANDLQSDQRRLFDPDDPDFDAGYCDQDRRHLATLNARVRDAGGWQRRRARAGVELAAVGHPQRALGEPAQHHQRRRQRVHGSIPRFSGPTRSAMTSMVRARTPPT